MAATIAEDFDKLAADNKIAPTIGTFDESKGVAGRVNTLTNAGSPLFETARTKAAQASAKRGLTNSTLGVQAGEQAVIETATPIASADASLYQQQQLSNQAAQNNASLVNANNAIQAGTQGRSLFEQARQFDTTTGQRGRELTLAEKAQADSLGLEQNKLGEAQRQFDTSTAEQGRQFDATTAQRMDLAKLDVDSRRELAQIEAEFKNEIQSSANISNAWGTLQQGIAQIQNNAELDPGTKAQLIQNQIASFQSFSNFWKKATGGAIDVSDLLSFGVAEGDYPAPAPAPAPAPGPQPGQPGYVAPGQLYDNQDWSSGP
ncbi:MAG: hypothetical protein Q8N17_26060 [Burkholderiaceae bacterium]|nr:hypothetical protein [Burkholderiaceae bacterium]